MNLKPDLAHKLKLFDKMPAFELTSSTIQAAKKPHACLFIVLVDYTFEIKVSNSSGGNNKRTVVLVIKDFFVHSLHERLTADIL